MDRIKDDSRFSHVLKDPRFRHMPKNERKVKIDKRFEGMFKDKRFKLKSTVDKRGRPINYSTTEDLKKYYELSSSDVDSDEGEEEEYSSSSKKLQNVCDRGETSGDERKLKAHLKKKNKLSDKANLVGKTQKGTKDKETSSETVTALSEWNEQQDTNEESEDEGSVDIARGEGNAESSDTEEESDSDDAEDERINHPWGELIQDAPETKEVTRRLAVCNMDWDRIKAQDLFTLLHSFKPPEGIIKHVKIYMSDFGKQRLQEEEVKGPAELVNETVSDNEEESVEGSKFHIEKLRKYQLNRLRYYYAVVECDSPETANKMYEECDGVEYESSATRMDLRFIPDDMLFNEEPISMSDSLPDPSSYRPNLFVTAALQQAKVNLTWDETDPDRIKATQRAFDKNELAKMDLSAYLASSDSDDDDYNNRERNSVKNDNQIESEEENEAHRISKYRALLQSIESEESKKKEQDVELEITWEPGLRDTTEKLVKQKLQEDEIVTPWEQYLQKRKEKKQKKREEQKKKKQSLKSGDQSPENAYSDDELPSDIDLQDPYFQEELGKEFKPKKSKKVNKKEPTEENKQEKAELELLLMDDDNQAKHHFSLKSMLHDGADKSKKKKKKKKGKADKSAATNEDNFEVNVEDNRFAALYTSHLYNVDPSDPQFQKTKGMHKIVEEKLRRRAATDDAVSSLYSAKKAKLEKTPPRNIVSSSERNELSVLVKSIKNKTQNFKRRKEK